MPQIAPNTLRRFSASELSDAPDAPNPKRLYTYMKGRDLIAPVSGGVNIVLSREIRRNVAIAAEMAIGIAKQDPTRRVVYINSYAGSALWKQALRAACEKHGLTKEDSLPNLCVLEVNIDRWNKDALRLAITGFDEEWKPLECGKEATIILNSFEYAALNRNKRPRIVRDLLQLQEEYSASIVLFSHELRQDILAGLPSRGAIGFMATRAVTVFQIADPFERLKEAATTRDRADRRMEQTGKGIHERQMRGEEHNILTSDQLPASKREAKSYANLGAFFHDHTLTEEDDLNADFRGQKHRAPALGR